MSTTTDRLRDLVAAARAAGADAADAVLVRDVGLSVTRRLGTVERIERAESTELGLRVLVATRGGRRQAIVSTGDTDPLGFPPLAERAVAMARAVPEDSFAALPEAVRFEPPAFDGTGLDLVSGAQPDVHDLTERAAQAEDAALAVAGITNSKGAEAGWNRRTVALVASNGFCGEYTRSAHHLSLTALAGHGTAMERDYEYLSAVHLTDLDDPATVGREVAARAIRRLNPGRLPTGRMPVVYHPRVAATLVGHLAAAVSGAAVARGTSFLRERMGERVLAAGLTVRDDPTRPRALRSRPFDGEGQPGAPLTLVEDGVLRSWILDSRAARQLALRPTGHAARSAGGVPSPAPSNLWLEPGTLSPEAIIADIREGFYVTELIGQGANILTGDYSRGAAGFAIRDGQIAEAVSGLTVAGNLGDMFLHLAAADDLRIHRGTDSPTLRVEGMTVAGG
ncbi:TldD/PmbA family protein [Roseomonas elaeocarpi]|uniref:TldD/PmbA family protein n=1 Tax=Roseomonas elaeocarpi TaxID=907779 RepID=A0ABV6JM49_9PROT